MNLDHSAEMCHDWCKSGTEHGHQMSLIAFISAVAIHYEEPKLLKLIFAIPNGGSRGGDSRSAQIEGGKLKAEGVRPGVSDLMVAIPRHDLHGLFIEMKKPKGRESDEQREFGDLVIQEGYWYICCYHWLDAAKLIMSYLGFDEAENAIVTLAASLEHALP